MANWFITGISSGLGLAIARLALARGDSVVGTTRSTQAVSDLADLAPGRAHGLIVDLTDEADIARAVAQAEELTSGIDVVVNNAGYGMTGAIEETGLDQIRALFDINVLAPVAVMQSVLPGMRKRRAGHIINITSVSGLAAWSGTAIYGASKFALECIGRTLAQEVEPLGIKVTNVAPGGFRSGFTGSALANADRSIADYAETAHQARITLTSHSGREPSDANLAAQRILDIAGQSEPPLLLLLGSDALKYAEQEFVLLQAEIDRWKPITLSVAAEE